MTFSEERIPDDISYGFVGGPEFSTNIITTHNGIEQRNSNWSIARARYRISHNIKNQTAINELITFFRARKGKAEGFRFKDWSDYQTSGQIIGYGDGFATDFQLIKSYISGNSTYNRNITKPITASYNIYINSVIQTEVTDYNLDITTGIVSFTAAPINDAIISADFEFDVPVRFDIDNLSITHENYGVINISDVELVEIII